MRTTLIIDDRLLREAKKRAAALGVTVSDVVNQALRHALASGRTSAPVPRFEMLVYGEEDARVHRDPDQLADAQEQEDRARLGR